MPIVGDVLAVRIYCTLQAQTAINVRHYVMVAVAGTGVTDQARADVFSNQWSAEYRALMANDARYYGTTVQTIHPLLGITAPYYSRAGTGVGSAGASALPKQTAAVITLVTATPGRNKSGRAYIPFPSEADNDAAGKMELGYYNRLAALGVKLTDTLSMGAGGNTEQWKPCVWARGPRSYRVIIGWRASDIWGTQRRRGDFGRINSPGF